MNLIVNGEEHHFSGVNTVQQLLMQLQLAEHPVAVERNGQLVRHSAFGQTELAEQDILEIVTLVGGG